MDDNSPLFTERRVAAWIGKALRVEGSIELGDHSLTIGPGAVVKADLTAKTITISGAVTGMVRATEKVDLREPGSVQGDIKAPRCVMAEGATVRGRIEAGTRAK